MKKNTIRSRHAKHAVKRPPKGGKHIRKAVAGGRHARKAVKVRRPVKAVAKKASAKAKVQEKKVVAARKKHNNKDYIPSQKEAVAALNAITADRFALDYINKNVSKNAVEVLNTITTPKTDEQISLLLNMKINFVRRMLNIMQGYGITNYYVAKNNNGWLSFAWYVNATKLQSFFEYIRSIRGDEVIITDNCNDYFVCGKCYDGTKMIFDFDAAFEAKFKCSSCGGKFKMINKQDAEQLITGPVAVEVKANQ